jgi:hypothetical protein
MDANRVGSGSYVVKLSTTTGAILWKVAVSNGSGFSDQGVCVSVIKTGTFLYYAPGGSFVGTVYVFDTSDGSFSTIAVTGIGNCSNQSSNDVFGCVIGNANWDASQGDLTILNDTPSAGASLAALYFVPAAPTGGSTSYFDVWGS